MLKVGLTGSIAVGKTFVSDVLKELGCYVLDADQTAREVVAPETPGWRKIVENFGNEILQPDKSINRAKLAAIVFTDEKKRQLLNAIVHPLVTEAQDEWMQKVEAEHSEAVAVIDAALMIESGSFRRFDKLIVVWCEPEIQLARLMKRNNLTQDEALRRIESQMPQEEKKKFSDFLIDTSLGFEDTRSQVDQIYMILSSLAVEK